MGPSALPTYDHTARKLASSLEEVADRLGRAQSVAEFVAALEENQKIWLRLVSAAGDFGWRVPRRLIDFALASSARARFGISDHDVEAMISINRSTSSTILAGGLAGTP